MAYYSTIVTALGLLAVLAVLCAVGLMGTLVAGGGRTRLRGALGGQERHPIAWAWVVAVIATSGSLYLSEVAHLVPCSLCWYQRIAMYPLVLVLGVGLFRSDPAVWRYAIPLPAVGLVIAVYHVVIQWRPTLEVVPCSTGVACSGRYLAIFGFVSIPTMSGAAFLLILTLLLLVRTLGQDGAQRPPSTEMI